MTNTSGFIQLLDGAEKWGFGLILLVFLLIFVGRPLLKTLAAWLSQKLVERPSHEVQIEKLYEAALDPETEEPIPLKGLFDRICGMDERQVCIPAQCPFHEQLLERLERYIEEGKSTREIQNKRMDELITNYGKVADAHIAIISGFLKQRGSHES